MRLGGEKGQSGVVGKGKDKDDRIGDYGVRETGVCGEEREGGTAGWTDAQVKQVKEYLSGK